jgi:HEAT repeats
VAPRVGESRAGYSLARAASARVKKPAAGSPAPAEAPSLFPDLADRAPVSEVQPARGAPPAEPSEPVQAPLLVPRVAALEGTYPERLTKVMKLRRDRTPQGLGTLIAALADPDANIRWLASFALSDVHGEGVAAALAEFLGSDAPVEGRLEAVKLLGKMGGDTARAALERIAGDARDDVGLRDAAQEALVGLRC